LNSIPQQRELGVGRPGYAKGNYIKNSLVDYLECVTLFHTCVATTPCALTAVQFYSLGTVMSLSLYKWKPSSPQADQMLCFR